MRYLGCSIFLLMIDLENFELPPSREFDTNMNVLTQKDEHSDTSCSIVANSRIANSRIRLVLYYGFQSHVIIP